MQTNLAFSRKVSERYVSIGCTVHPHQLIFIFLDNRQKTITTPANAPRNVPIADQLDGEMVPFDMPNDFFKVDRGAEFFTKGREFRVSNPVDGTDDEFDSIKRRVAKEFQTFSPKHLFTSLESTVTVAEFSVPGVAGDATVSGFGSVFTDVDRRGTTSIKYFDSEGCVIFALTILDKSRVLSFGGIKVLKKDGKHVVAPVAKVEISSGNRIIKNLNGDRWGDIVVMDEFLYGEPQPKR